MAFPQLLLVSSSIHIFLSNISFTNQHVTKKRPSFEKTNQKRAFLYDYISYPYLLSKRLVNYYAFLRFINNIAPRVNNKRPAPTENHIKDVFPPVAGNVPAFDVFPVLG